MQTIGMEYCGIVAGGDDAARNVLTQQDRMLIVVQSVWGPMSKPVVVRQTTVKKLS